MSRMAFAFWLLVAVAVVGAASYWVGRHVIGARLVEGLQPKPSTAEPPRQTLTTKQPSVKVEVLRSDQPDKRESEEGDAGLPGSGTARFTVQVGAFSSKEGAARLTRKLSQAGFPVRKASQSSGDSFVVEVGEFTTRKQAEAEVTKLRKKGFDGFVKRETSHQVGS